MLQKIHFNLYFLIICLSVLNGQAQCPIITPNNFGVPAVVCPDQNISFTNPDASSNVTYEWDFCSQDMLATPNIDAIGSVFGANIATENRIVYDGTEYYIFFLSLNASKLYRIDLGNSPTNSPKAIHDLGNLGILSGPWTLNIIKDQTTGLWYGITLNYQANQFIRLTFGASLKNTPSASFMGSLSPNYNRISTTKLIEAGGSYYLFVVGYVSNSLAVVSLGSSLTNNISISNIINNVALPTLSEPNDLELIRDCNTNVWSLILVSSIGNRLLHFTSGFANTPVISTQSYASGFGIPTGIAFVQENGAYYAVMMDINGNIEVDNYGNAITNTPSQTFWGPVSSNANFKNSYGIESIIEGNTISVFAQNYTTNTLFRMNFKRDCGVNTSSSSLTNPTNIRYRNVGLHPVTLKVRNNVGNIIQTYLGDVNVNNTTTVGNFISSNVCVGSSMLFQNTSVGSDTQVSSWAWDFGDGNVSNLKNPTHIYNAAGNYNVTLTVNNTNGCSNSITKQVIVSNGVNADFQGIATACVGQPIQLNNLSTYTNLPFDEASGFYWNFGDGTYSPFQNPSKIYYTTGTYSISLTVKDQAGCTDIVSKNIQILENPSVSFNFPMRICVGNPVQFTSVASSASAYSWSFEAHGTSNNANPTVTFSKPGFYDVKLEVKNSNNCTSSFIVENIEVLDAPNIIFNAQKTATNLLEINFTNFSSGAVAYEWDFGDGMKSQETNPKHAYQQAGEYVVSLKARTANGCENSISQVVGAGTLQTDLAINQAVLTNDKLNIELENKGNTLLNQISIEVQIGDTTFKEIYPNTIALGEKVNLNLQTILPTELLSKNSYICLNVMPKPSLQDSNVKNNQACINLSNRFTVFEPYPNPTSDNLTISFTAPNTGSVKIAFTDVVGRNINYQILANIGYNEQSLSLKGLAKGLYVVSFEYENKVLYKKVIVQ